MGPEIQLLSTQEPDTCPFLEPDESGQHSPILFLLNRINIILQFTPGSSKQSGGHGFDSRWSRWKFKLT